MGQVAQNLRDILSLARMLRGLAGGHANDPTHDEFLATAAELEARAHFLATGETAPLNQVRDAALHAPVDLKI